MRNISANRKVNSTVGASPDKTRLEGFRRNDGPGDAIKERRQKVTGINRVRSLQ